MIRKLLAKLNIIDFLLLAILLISILALVYKLTLGKSNNTETFLFTYVCEATPSETLDEVAIGLPCLDSDSGTSLGELANIETAILEDASGKQKAIFTSSLIGQREENGISVDKALYLKGKHFNLIIGDSIFSVYLSDIQTLY